MKNGEKVCYWILEGLLAEPLNIKTEGKDYKQLYKELEPHIEILRQKMRNKGSIFKSGFGYVTYARKVLWFDLVRNKCYECTMNGEIINEYDVSSFRLPNGKTQGEDVAELLAVCGALGVRIKQ